MKLFRLTLRTLLVRKVWVVALLCVGVLPFVLPVLVPTEFASGLVEPARAQAAWVLLWLVTLFWMFGQGAKQGDSNARSGVGLYFQSLGYGRFRQMGEIWLAHVCFLFPLTLLAVFVCLGGAMPSQGHEAEAWIYINLQYAALFLVATLPLLMLTIAFGSRFGALVGFLSSLGLSLYGLYGIGYLEVASQSETNSLVRVLYSVSPHYHLADLTDRLVFKMGHLDWGHFASIVTYLSGILFILFAGSGFTFRPTVRA
ncbi:MAG: hypothetical protein AAGC74_03615 [Verrucomicrobiota bacterium]